MKKTLTHTLTLALLLGLTTSAFALSVSEVLKWEKAVATYLNKSDIEVYNVKVTSQGLVRDLAFTYDQELSYAPGRYATFECTGTADLETYTVFNLDCEEEEPILIDEP